MAGSENSGCHLGAPKPRAVIVRSGHNAPRHLVKNSMARRETSMTSSMSSSAKALEGASSSAVNLIGAIVVMQESLGMQSSIPTVLFATAVTADAWASIYLSALCGVFSILPPKRRVMPQRALSGGSTVLLKRCRSALRRSRTFLIPKSSSLAAPPLFHCSAGSTKGSECFGPRFAKIWAANGYV